MNETNFVEYSESFTVHVTVIFDLENLLDFFFLENSSMASQGRATLSPWHHRGNVLNGSTKMGGDSHSYGFHLASGGGHWCSFPLDPRRWKWLRSAGEISANWVRGSPFLLQIRSDCEYLRISESAKDILVNIYGQLNAMSPSSQSTGAL